MCIPVSLWKESYEDMRIETPEGPDLQCTVGGESSIAPVAAPRCGIQSALS